MFRCSSVDQSCPLRFPSFATNGVPFKLGQEMEYSSFVFFNPAECRDFDFSCDSDKFQTFLLFATHLFQSDLKSTKRERVIAALMCLPLRSATRGEGTNLFNC